jgi:hypothetical protein
MLMSIGIQALREQIPAASLHDVAYAHFSGDRPYTKHRDPLSLYGHPLAPSSFIADSH